MASLFVVRGNDQGARFELNQDVVTLGRDASNTIQLHDTEVSRRHASVRRTGRAYALVDLGSSNGTFVNGQRVQTRELASGDEVVLGGTAMLFTGGGDEPDSGLAEKIDVIARHQPEDRSRIVHALPHEEGSRMFLLGTPAEESPWLARARSNFQIMYHTALAVSHTLDIDQLLDRILQLIFEWVECDRGCVLLWEPDANRLEPRVRRGRDAAHESDRIAISKTILDYVLQRHEGVLTTDAQEDQRWDPAASIVRQGVREAICVPMRGRHSFAGVIYIDTLTPAHALVDRPAVPKFNEEHLQLMVAIGHQAALAIEDTRYYQAMVQAERLAAVGQAIATLSHHVKNILQGIRGGGFLIQEGLKNHNEEMVRKGWQFVEKNQERISHLVLDMLTFSKEREPEMTPADLNRVVADVVELMERHAQGCGVTIGFEPAPGLPRLTFDPEGLHRAVLNVVTNAIDASDPSRREDRPEDQEPVPGAVRVRVEYQPELELVRVLVEDNGVGIPPEELEHVFSLFVSSKGARGTGLGLPVSQKIVREHGGRVLVESEVGRGTRFTLELPAVLAEATQALEPPDGSDAQPQPSPA